MKKLIQVQTGSKTVTSTNKLIKIAAALSFASLFPSAGIAQTGSPIIATENHVGLAVKNLDAEKQWYENVFGMKEEQHFELAQYHVRTVLLRSPNGLGMELIEVKGAVRKREYKNALDAASDLGYGHWAIVVSDLKQAYSQLISEGATSVSAPAPAVQAGGSFAYVKDPEGNLIEVMQVPSK
jgi:catechol 2,3-dioxygenase-like lactoylglutathione lyase family enzyme